VLVALVILARLVALGWAIAFAMRMGRVGNELSKARPIIHASSIAKLAVVAPLLVLCVAAYARPFLEAGTVSPLVVLLVECASIGVTWLLLINNPVNDS
jgi:hypothetical protein